MASSLAESLRSILGAERRALLTLNDETSFSKPGGADSWSPKQELGHLIDSAVNNHMRFVLSGTGHSPLELPGYAQNAWVNVHNYQDMPWEDIVGFWHNYNVFIAHLLEQIPEAAFSNSCSIGGTAPVTLHFLVKDYMVHMQHHLDHLLARPVITPYPQVG